jgi:hypothetical protein
MELLELASKLKPIVLGWLDEAVVAGTPGAHALDPAIGPHTGTLTLNYLDQSGASAGQAPVWSGSAWTPTDVATQAELDAHNHDHGALTGLGDDDHGAVYPGLSQAETITGLWTFDRDPNAPFAVAAGSALVTNLDADLLDGQHASAFAAVGHNHDHGALTGLGDDDHGAVYPGLAQSETITGLWTFDRDPNAPFAVAAGSAVVTNLNADLLDGQHASAFAAAGHNHDHGTLTGLGDDDHGAVYPGLSQAETITGLWTFDRDPNAPFAVAAGSALVTNLNADLLDGQHASAFATAGHTHAHSALTGIGANDHHNQLHASTHISGGGDQIDGDQLDIDWNPTNYVPATTPPQVSSVDHLTAHLYGIDQAISESETKQQVFSFGCGMEKSSTSWQDAAGDFCYVTTVYPKRNPTWRVTMKAPAGQQADVQLYDVTNSSQVAVLSTTSTSWVHLSTSVSFISSHYYRLRLRSSGGSSAFILGSYLEW